MNIALLTATSVNRVIFTFLTSLFCIIKHVSCTVCPRKGTDAGFDGKPSMLGFPNNQNCKINVLISFGHIHISVVW